MVFLFDENVPYRFVDGLALIEQSNHKSPIPATILSPKILGKTGAPDEEIIALAGKHNAIIYSIDGDFKHQKSYYPLYKKHNVGVVFITPPKKYSYWDIVLMVMNNWEKLKAKLHDKKKPFIVQVTQYGIQDLSF